MRICRVNQKTLFVADDDLAIADGHLADEQVFVAVECADQAVDCYRLSSGQALLHISGEVGTYASVDDSLGTGQNYAETARAAGRLSGNYFLYGSCRREFVTR